MQRMRNRFQLAEVGGLFLKRHWMAIAVFFSFVAGMVGASCAERPKGTNTRTPATAERGSTDLFDSQRVEVNPALAGRLSKVFLLMNKHADLAASDVEFKADFHFGVDQWFNHRVEATITNVDSVWYGNGGRQWELYSFDPNAGPYGIQLIDSGHVPNLAPGAQHNIKVSLPPSVNFQAMYALILSSGDPNPDNDIAVDSPN